jgi:nucleolar MIF4G domain-containing protein 1
MIETINDLKNNKLRSTFVGLSAEQITRMRKILGSLNSRNIRASEPLRIGREDIHNSAKTGKWWLVGASWKNEADGDHKADGLGTVSSAAVLPDTLDDDLGASTVDLAQLARDHRMNTDVRRSIFVAIMSATDCRDAQVRLGKLRLKRKQEVEIPRVLIHCASEEESYNPYYTLIARKLCGEKRLKMAFMFALWDVFKRIGERNNMEDSEDSDDDMADQEGENTLNTRAVVNLAKMYGNLVADGALTLGVLKVLDFLYLQQKTRTFLELLLITAILQTQKTATRDEKKLADVFMRTRDTPQVVSGLIFFLRKVVSKSDIVSSKREKETLKWGCRVALDSLRVVAEGVS